MEIRSKFGINELVVSKYQKSAFINMVDAVCCFEVIEIKTQTCMAGTQIFYVLRSIHAVQTTDYKDGKRVTSIEAFMPGANSRDEYVMFREDELKPASKELIDAINPGNA